MYAVAHKLGYGRLGNEVREAARHELFELWRPVRPVLLREFDRQEPTFAVTDTRPPGQTATAVVASPKFIDPAPPVV